MRLCLIFALVLALVGLSPRPQEPAASAAPSPALEAWQAVPDLSQVEIDEPITPELAGLPEDPIVIPPVKVQEHDYGCDTYPIRARGYDKKTGEARYPMGSCVSVGKGRFATVKHIVESLKPGYVVEVRIAEEWHNAHFWLNEFVDFAYVDIAKTDLPEVEMREPVYGERVTIYGLTSCKPMQGGFFADVVGLDASEPGVASGDSGGGVYGEDGALVAVVSGYGADKRSVVVTAVRLVQPEKLVPDTPKAKEPTPVQAAPKVAPVQAQRSNCPGGICPAPRTYQPQRVFRGRFR